MGKSKVESVEVSGSWEKDGTKFFTHQYVMADGQKIQANHKTEKPLGVGTEVEYEVKKTHEKYGDSGKVSKPNDFAAGGGRTIMAELKDIKRMCASNAVHAVATVNANAKKEVVKSSELAAIVAFTLGDIKSDIPKFKEEDSLLTSRLSAINNASIMSAYKNVTSGDELVAIASKLYAYIIK